MLVTVPAETDPVGALAEQARSAMREFRAIERYFQDPDGLHASQARAAAAEAAQAWQRLEERSQSDSSPRGSRRTALAASRAVGRMAAAGKALIEEVTRFGIGEDRALQEMAHEARRAAEELARALERLAQRSEQAEHAAGVAARAAGRAEHLRRGATRSLGEEPDAVRVIKLRALHRRFSEAAFHASEAADLIAELPAEAG